MEEKDLHREGHHHGKKSYDAKDIQVLEGLDAVRMRPGMYIGTTSIKGLHHILWEIVDNSIDEVSNGFGDAIHITLYPDGSASVEDNGRGIPVDIHPQLKVSGVEVVFTQLHAGGKFGNSNYAYSGGLHGVGASVTNALSEWLKVEVYKNKTTYAMDFASVEVGGKVKGGVPQSKLTDTGVPSLGTGSKVTFKPDARIFDDVTFRADTIIKRLKELAFLNKGVSIVFDDKRNPDEPMHREYLYEGGIVDFVRYLNEVETPIHEPVYFEGEYNGIFLAAAIQYNDSYADKVVSYVNNIPTSEGGMHETGFKAALTRVGNDLARKYGLLKEKEPNLIGEDFREGMTVVLSVKMTNVQFEGQTKTKLGNAEARVACETITINNLSELFSEHHHNRHIAEKIIEKAIGAAKAREAAKKAKETSRAAKSIGFETLVGKLAACSGKKAEDNELYIVEGDSAGGSAKQARKRSFQAILPLRGKPLNTEKKRIDQILANEEIRTLINALGTGIGEDFNLDNLKYHKVVILSDADQDGAHIRAILLTFFFRYMRDLIYDGHVYIGMPPLYKVYKKDTIIYAYSDKELEEAKQKIGRGYQIQRYKGLGEMNPEQLWETTLDPERRMMIRVSIESAAEADRLVTTLMGDAIEARKQYIIDNVNFDKEDEFVKEVNL